MQYRNLRVAMAAAFFALLCSPRLRSQSVGPVSRVEDSVFAGLVKPGEPGFAVLLRYGGKDFYLRIEGVRDLRSKAKIDSQTNFRLASFTKQFTAMAIMLSLIHI